MVLQRIEYKTTYDVCYGQATRTPSDQIVLPNMAVRRQTEAMADVAQLLART